MKDTLFGISDDLIARYELIFEMEGEIVDEVQEAALDEWLEELNERTDRKLGAYALLIEELEARAEARKAKAARLDHRAKMDQNAADRMKARLLNFFETHDLKTVETEHGKISKRKNGGLAPLVVHCKPEDLPVEFQRKIIAADNQAIREVLKSGETLEFAEILPRGFHIRIE